MTKVKQRKRGRNRKNSQAEKLLTILLSGNEVTLEEVNQTLEQQIEVYRLSTYLWNLSQLGAKIKKTKTGRKLNTLQLVNVEEMRKYFGDRQEEIAKNKPRPKPQEIVLVSASIPKEIDTTHAEEISDPEEGPPALLIDSGLESHDNF